MIDQQAAIDPSLDLEPQLAKVPARWVVYLMSDAEDRPLQLLCVKNLRASLRRRLGEPPPEGAGRKIDYRQVVRRIQWRRVDSAFEADVVYLEAARQLFPQQYRGMLGMRPAWFVHVNPDTTYPRYVKTVDPTGRTGRYFGPIDDKHAAQKLMHTMENLFDLCRDYSILTQSPNAGPCPWKQMNKCVGPCDGSIDLEAYQQLIAFSASVLADPLDYIREQTRRMRHAAAELRFESAQKIKAYIDQLSVLGKGHFRHVRPLDELRFVTLQRGPRAGTAKVFLIMPGTIEEIAGLVAEPSGELLRHVLTVAHETDGVGVDKTGVERIGVVAHHLFMPKAKQGVFLPLETIDDKLLLKAFRELQNQKVQEEANGEGVTKELQAL